MTPLPRRPARPVLLAAAALVSGGLVGCFSDRGLAIEIDVGNTGATSVELFLGATACDAGSNPAGIDCKAIGPPPPGAGPLRGEVWFRDGAQSDVARIVDNRATFRFRADSAMTVPIVIAVGRADMPGAIDPPPIATAVLYDAAIPTDAAQVLRASLTPAAPMQPGATAGPAVIEDRVMVWHKQSATSCVAVEHWVGGMVTRSFIVPASDPDCDDVVASECKPAEFLGQAAPGEAPRPDCVASEGNGDGDGEGDVAGAGCVLGSHGCSDGSATQTGACGPQRARACMPDALCGCDQLDPACLTGALRDPGMMATHIECTFPAEDAIAPCINAASAEISLDDPFRGETCGPPLIGSLDLALFAPTANFHGVVLELSPPRSPCTFSVTWRSGSRAAINGPDDAGAITIPATGGAVVLPVTLHFATVPPGGCPGAGAPMCRFVDPLGPSDGVWRCMLP